LAKEADEQEQRMIEDERQREYEEFASKNDDVDEVVILPKYKMNERL
jgi:hypothetical protein